MKTNQELFQEHMTRALAAIALEKPDRTPVFLSSDSFHATHLRIKLSEVVKNHERFTGVILESTKLLGDVDAIAMTTFDPDLLSFSSLSNVKIPGRDLPEDMLWQVDEHELVTDEDYDMILNKGWDAFFGYYAKVKLNLFEKLGAYFNYTPQDVIRTTEAGYLAFCPHKTGTPFDMLSGGRGMTKFVQDLYRKPDKIQEVLNVISEASIRRNTDMINQTRAFSVYYGSGRASSQFLSRKFFERFAFPYMKAAMDKMIEDGAFVYLHIDGDWIRDLELFRELPKAKIFVGTDGTSDIFKYKEILGDMFCIYGDVPPALLTLGTADEVYNYCTRLINEIGPSGFILAPGCAIPKNAKVENVKAMISAAAGK